MVSQMVNLKQLVAYLHEIYGGPVEIEGTRELGAEAQGPPARVPCSTADLNAVASARMSAKPDFQKPFLIGVSSFEPN